MTGRTDGGFPSLTPPACTSVVVVAAHPDDETLGCGGLAHAMHVAVEPITFVFASDGEAADPALDDEARRRLAKTRIAESTAAVTELAPGAAIVRLHLPDSALADHEDAIVDALRSSCTSGTLVVAPHPRDLHPDHEAVGRAAERVARERGCVRLAYGIWMWEWPRDDDAYDWTTARTFALDTVSHRAKQAAMSRYASQTEDRTTSGPVVGATVLDRQLADHENYFVAGADSDGSGRSDVTQDRRHVGTRADSSRPSA